MTTSARGTPHVRRCVGLVLLAAISCSETEIDVEVHGDVALIEGFGVPSFRLASKRNDAGELIVSWAAEEETVLVRCAVFHRPPTFKKVEGAYESPSGNLRTITNYDACTLATQDTRGAVGELNLHNLPITSTADLAVEMARNMNMEPVTTVSLAVGCWSFSEADVNGATSLVTVFPSDLEDLRGHGVSLECVEPNQVCEVLNSAGKPALIGICGVPGEDGSPAECSPVCTDNGDCTAVTEALGVAYGDCGEKRCLRAPPPAAEGGGGGT